MTNKSKCVRSFGAALVFIVISGFLTAAPCRACFSIVVGKDASADDCVIVGHNEDDGAPQIVNHHKVLRRRHYPGDLFTLHNGGTLPQAEQTWAYLWSEMPGMLYSDSYVNEWGVTVTSDNCPSREDRPEISDGGIGYLLRRLIAQRARTAREGVRLAGRLVERFGYVDSGRTYIIADPNEGWLCCVVNGKHWLARRVPDDEVAMVANTYTIRQVDLNDGDNFLAADDIVDYARRRGWYDAGADGAFNFATAYANRESSSHPNNFGRQWSGLMYVTGRALELRPDLPFSVRPQRKLGVADVMRVLRHDKEAGPGSAFCDIDAINEQGCALCNAGTQTSFVARLRSDIPRDIGIVYWVCLAEPRTSFYMPFHFGISSFPAGFCGASERPTEAYYERKVKGPFVPDASEAFWAFSNFRNKVENADAPTIGRIKNEARRLEADMLALEGPLEETACKLHRTAPTAAAALLENHAKGAYLSCLETMSTLLPDEVGDEAELRQEAQRLAHELLLLDSHVDTPLRLYREGADLTVRDKKGHLDYVRAREGGLDAVFMAVYVSPRLEETGQARSFAEKTIDLVHECARHAPGKFAMATSVEELRKQFDRRRVTFVLGMENGAPVEGRLAHLEHFHERGIRYITLCHSENNHICDSSFDDGPYWHGLSPFGKEMVAEMNRLGLIIDVSHVSDETFYQVMQLSQAPIVATHSGCRHFTPGWHRNMSDDMIRLLAEKGGVVQIPFGSIFVNTAVNRQFEELEVDIRRQAQGLTGTEMDRYEHERWEQAQFSRAHIADVAANIDHVVRLVGIDHVGLGSDFDGVENLPEGLKDASCYPNLIYELLKKGYTEDDLRRICGENFLRVWSQVEATARAIQSDASGGR